MEKDCHYYVMYLLSLVSGFNPDEAYEMAYCSQYVDDSLDGHEKKLFDLNGEYVGTFDPIRTAHNGFKSIGIDVQEKIYYPFHFLPGLKGRSFSDKMVTKSGLKGRLFHVLIDEVLAKDDLSRVGITLHVLADTYSHCDFSGLWTWSNKLAKVNFIPNKKNPMLNLLSKWLWMSKRFWFTAAPPIGHSNAFVFPDIPSLDWKFRDYNDKFVSKSNNIKFVKAFLDIYDILLLKFAQKRDKTPRLQTDKAGNNEELRQILWEGVNFTGSLKKRCRNWRSIIINMVEDYNRDKKPEEKLNIPPQHLDYDKGLWEKTVMKKKRFFLIFDSPRRKLKVSLEDFIKSSYHQFHVAARAHRTLVLEKINEFYYQEIEKDERKDIAAELMISKAIINRTRSRKTLNKVQL